MCGLLVLVASSVAALEFAPPQARVPLSFIENLGQWEGPSRFVARRGGMAAFLAPDSITLQLARHEPIEERPPGSEGPETTLRGVNLRLVFEGASESVRLLGRGETPTLHHYFLGTDPARWRANLRGSRTVVYEDLYEGVDLVVREERSHLEYDLLFAPCTDLDRVVVRVEGLCRPLRTGDDGTLLLETALGVVRQPEPRTWQEDRLGRRVPRRSAYRIKGPDRFAVEVPEREPNLPLVVDPGLDFSTFLGGFFPDVGYGVALDAGGAAFVAGLTSGNFLATPGAFDTAGPGGNDAFVAKLSPSGDALLYATFFGGISDDRPRSVAVDGTGAASVVGWTQSSNFPTTPGAFDTTYGGIHDAFVARFTPAGGGFIYSTFLGGSYLDEGLAVAVDASGAAVASGYTWSSDFPTTSGAYDTTLDGFGDAFVTKFSPTGAALFFSSFLGGSDYDAVHSIALDAAGAATVAGYTYGAFPTTAGAFGTSYNGGTDAFVARLSPSGDALLFASYLGGTEIDFANAVALDHQGRFAVAGRTRSADFPVTPAAFDPIHNGLDDAFVSVFSPSGADLLDSTYLGGIWDDEAIAVRFQGAVTVTGKASSANFPTSSGAFDTTWNGSSDVFVTRLAPLAGGLLHSTFLGGPFDEWVYGLAVDAAGTAVVTGLTPSPDFPTTPGAYDTTYNGGNCDAFVARLDLLPAGVAAYGFSSPGCPGPSVIGALSSPQVGNGAFAITCVNAPPANSSGFLGVSAGALSSPLTIAGVAFWIDLSSPAFVAMPATSDPAGTAFVPIPVPAEPAIAGSQVFAQFLWTNDPCTPTGGSASNALAIVVQP